MAPLHPQTTNTAQYAGLAAGGGLSREDMKKVQKERGNEKEAQLNANNPSGDGEIGNPIKEAAIDTKPHDSTRLLFNKFNGFINMPAVKSLETLKSNAISDFHKNQISIAMSNLLPWLKDFVNSLTQSEFIATSQLSIAASTSDNISIQPISEIVNHLHSFNLHPLNLQKIGNHVREFLDSGIETVKFRALRAIWKEFFDYYEHHAKNNTRLVKRDYPNGTNNPFETEGAWLFIILAILAGLIAIYVLYRICKWLSIKVSPILVESFNTLKNWHQRRSRIHNHDNRPAIEPNDTELEGFAASQ